MTNLLIQSLKSTDPLLVDKTTKNTPIFKEQFQDQLSKETKKQFIEKKREFVTEKNTVENKEREVKEEQEQENKFVFLGSIVTAKQEQSNLLKIDLPEVGEQTIQKSNTGYIKIAEVATKSNGVLSIQEQQVEKLARADTRFNHFETSKKQSEQPASATVVLKNNESPSTLVEDTVRTPTENQDGQMSKSLILTKEWENLATPIELAKTDKELNFLSADRKEATDKTNQPNKNSSNTSEDPSIEDKKVSVLKKDSVDVKSIIDKLAVPQKNTNKSTILMKESEMKQILTKSIKDSEKLIGQRVETNELVIEADVEKKEFTHFKNKNSSSTVKLSEGINAQKTTSEVSELPNESNGESFTSPRWLTKDWSDLSEIKIDSELAQVLAVGTKNSIKMMSQPPGSKELRTLGAMDNEKEVVHSTADVLELDVKLEQITQNHKSINEPLVVEDKSNLTFFDQLTTPRMLSKEWAQYKRPVVLEETSEIRQEPFGESNGVIKLDEFSGKMHFSENELPLLSTRGIADKEQLLTKQEDGDTTIKSDSLFGVQRTSSESMTIKSANQEIIRQKLSYEVNQLISKEVEQVQLKGQSSAKVTLSPEGMGDISISLELKDKVLSTKIVVDSLKIQELLTGSVPRLSDNLNRHSIQIGEVTIQLATSEQNSSHFDQKQHKKSQQSKRNMDRGLFTKSAPIHTTSETNKKTGRLSILV